MKCFLVIGDERANDVRRWAELVSTQIGDAWRKISFVKSPSQAEIILVAGGDGAMFRAIHHYRRWHLPFLGINRGTVGFLLNPISFLDELIDSLEHYEQNREIELRLAKATLISQNGKTKIYFVFQDVYLNAKHGTTIVGKVQGEKYPRQYFQGDGIIVATPQGSTAYNRSAGGAILPLEHNVLSITTICPMTRRIQAVVAAQRLEIEVIKGSAIAHADKQKMIDTRSVVVEPTEETVKLVFIAGYDFEVKRYQMNEYKITP